MRPKDPDWIANSVDPYQIQLGLQYSLSYVCPNIWNSYVISINKCSMKVFAGRACPKVNFDGYGWRYCERLRLWLLSQILTSWRFVQRVFIKLHHRKVSTRTVFWRWGLRKVSSIYIWKNSFESSIKELWNAVLTKAKIMKDIFRTFLGGFYKVNSHIYQMDQSCAV